MTLIRDLTDLVNKEVLKFAQRVTEAFPQIPIDALLKIWCYQQEMDIAMFSMYQEEDLTSPAKVEEEEGFTCKHKFLKGRNANTQCKTKIKWDGEYCSKHKK